MAFSLHGQPVSFLNVHAGVHVDLHRVFLLFVGIQLGGCADLSQLDAERRGAALGNRHYIHVLHLRKTLLKLATRFIQSTAGHDTALLPILICAFQLRVF